MNIYPAIDLRGGRCVRLLKGDFAKETVYSDNPGAMAQVWSNGGADAIHVVDLDGALAGESKNLPAIKAILQNSTIPVELGGGIRTLEQVEQLLALGLHQVILGSIAVKNPKFVEKAAQNYPGRIVAGIDAKNGIVAVEGWEKSGQMAAADLAKAMAKAGVARIIYTDIARDGTLTGVNLEETIAVAKAAGIPVTASGGVAGLADLKAVKKAEPYGVEGCIIGKALYTGAITLADAVRLAKEEQDAD